MDSGKWIRSLRDERLIKPSDVERITRNIAEKKDNSDFYVSHSTLADIETGSIPCGIDTRSLGRKMMPCPTCCLRNHWWRSIPPRTPLRCFCGKHFVIDRCTWFGTPRDTPAAGVKLTERNSRYCRIRFRGSRCG